MKKLNICFLLLPILLSSCKSKESNQSNISSSTESGYIKEDTKIDFLCMADKDYHAKLQSMIDEFEILEPHVKVNLYNPQGSGSYAMIEKNIVAGFFKEDYPDLAQCYPDNVVKYIAKGYAVDVDKYLSNSEYGIVGNEIDDYIDSFLLEGATYPTSGTYSLPFCKSTELLYYNADALLNLDLSSIDANINDGKPLDENYLNDLTWEELFDNLCPALYTYNSSLSEEDKILKSGTNSAVFTYDSDENFFITLANQYGYGYTSVDGNGKASIDFDNPEMKGLVRKLKEAKDANYLQTRGSNRDYVSTLFQDRKALFTISSTAGLTYNYSYNNPFNIGVAKIPHAEGKEYSSINQGPSVCILDHDDDNRSLASYLLWKHMTNEENSSAWALHTGYMGIRNSSYHSKEYIDALNVDDTSNLFDVAKAKNLKMISEVRESTFNTKVFKGSSNARTNVGLLLRDCLLSNDIDNEIDSLFSSYALDASSYLS